MITRPLLYMFVGLAGVAAGPWWAPLLGVPCYHVVEYAAHRWILHGPWDARTGWVLHGAHHAAPRDAARMPVPLRVVLPGALGILALLAALVPIGVALGLAGTMLAHFGLFEVVHLGTHKLGPLAGRLPRYIVRHHAWHHYCRGDQGFGVSSTWVDSLFGTSCRSLPVVDVEMELPGLSVATQGATPELAAAEAVLWTLGDGALGSHTVKVGGDRYTVKTATVRSVIGVARSSEQGSTSA